MQTIKFTEEHPFRGAIKAIFKAYFSSNNLSKNGGIAITIKTVVMLALYIIPFILLLTVADSYLLALPLIFIMGLGQNGLAMGVMHDAAHGALSKIKWVNNLVARVTTYLLGSNDTNWRIQHTHHHTYTNIHGADEDIDSGGLLRFSPDQERRWFHRWQHIYAWPLYGLFALSRFLGEPFRISKYIKNGEKKKFDFQSPAFEYIKMLLIKLNYLALTIVLPLQVTEYSLIEILVGWFILHSFSGFIMALIFQLAHVVEEAQYPKPNEEYKMPDDWAVHELRTTSNFKTWWGLSYLIGGLNYQVEHHLDPKISHVHYPALSALVKNTAEKFNLPYNQKPSFFQAVVSHYRQLKQLGIA